METYEDVKAALTRAEGTADQKGKIEIYVKIIDQAITQANTKDCCEIIDHSKYHLEYLRKRKFRNKANDTTRVVCIWGYLERPGPPFGAMWRTINLFFSI